MSVLGTMLAFVGLTAVKREPNDGMNQSKVVPIGPADDLMREVIAYRRSRELMLEHIASTEMELMRTVEERDMWRRRYEHLLAASHACQHQAQWSQAGPWR